MSSSVHFRFKSAREFETLSFEGDFLKVADLKVAIVERKKLNFGEGFDLEISDASTGDVFNDESALVQKNTSVIVRRIPGLKQGGILSHQEMAAKNERYAEKQGAKAQQQSAVSTDQNPVLPKTIEGSDEAERIASLVMQSNVQYDQFPPPVRGRYSNRSNNRGRGGSFGAGRNAPGQSSFPNVSHSISAYPDRAPRPSSNYVCHRCNRPGHWIDLCPTNGDPTYDRIKVRAPTGIPRSMLRQVDAPESGTGLQDSSGHFVTLQPNEEEFARQTVGLRLSQAAASGVDKDTVPSASGRDDENALRGDKNSMTPDSGPQQDGQDDVKQNAKPASTNGRQEVLGKSVHDKKDTETDGSKEEANGFVIRDKTGTDLLHESGSDSHPHENVTKAREEGGLTHHGKKPSVSARVRQPQLPRRVGVPQLPMPAIPPGFPPLGMPPIPPGMPPIPPHILMAMAMSNRQNGRPPQLPPGIHPSIPMPFSTPPTSSLDQKDQEVVTETQNASENEKLASGAASPEDAVGKRMSRDRKPVPESQKSRLNRDKSKADAREMEGSDQQGVDRHSELVDSAFNAKPDSHPSTLRLDRGDARDLKQHFFHENDDGLHNESGPYNRKQATYRSRSPSSSRVRSSPDEVKASPRQREQRDRTDEACKSLSPRRTAFEHRHARSGGREERNMRYRSSGYREEARPDGKPGGGEGGFYSRKRSLSPTLRERGGMNGTVPPESYAGRNRSPTRRTRYSSPIRHLRGKSSRGWGGKESPENRFRRDGQTERRLRSKTPPRRSRYDTRAREDFHFRQHRVPDIRRSPSVGEGRDPVRGPDENRRRYEQVERTRLAISESERDERGPRNGAQDDRHYPAESRKRSQDILERSSQDSRDERIRQDVSTGRRRKRDFDRQWDSEQGDLKRLRREHAEERKSVYYQEMKDRPSVHDRLGRPVEKRRRKRPRRSVHDRLG